MHLIYVSSNRAFDSPTEMRIHSSSFEQKRTLTRVRDNLQRCQHTTV